jgi:uncharacterized membrane protein
MDESRSRAADSERHRAPTIPPPILDASQRRDLEDRIAGRITDFAGSMRFVYLHTAWFAMWIIINAGLLLAMGLGIVPFDPFPFGLLTMVVSLESIYLSTFVMIAQNRQSAVADSRAKADYAINVQAEAETARLLHLIEALIEQHAQKVEDMPTALADPKQAV